MHMQCSHLFSFPHLPGSGKTTRYPLFLSLFADDSTSNGGLSKPKVVVAQPRRLACVTAAERVAYEQGYLDETSGGGVRENCPIGYAIRFDAHLAPPDAAHTVDFCTPGVLLRRAMRDPLFKNVSHLGTSLLRLTKCGGLMIIITNGACV